MSTAHDVILTAIGWPKPLLGMDRAEPLSWFKESIEVGVPVNFAPSRPKKCSSFVVSNVAFEDD